MSDHDHDHDEGSHFSDVELRVKALESLLVEKGLVDPEALDKLIDTFETRIGPRNGARVVARAWTDPAYRQRLRDDATAAIAELGYSGSRASTWWSSRTRRRCTTWSCARCAPVIPGRCSVCRRSGTSPTPIARAR